MDNNSDTYMRNIALYYPSLEHSGGIESVVVELCRIFSGNGFGCVLITDMMPKFYGNRISVCCELLPNDKTERRNSWKRVLLQHTVDYVITNGGFGASWEEDISSIHDSGAKVINTIHFSFPSPILFNEAWNSYKVALDIGLACDAVATVSGIDAMWWRALGCNAYHVQNPFTYYDHSDLRVNYGNHTMIWVGRGAPQKKPFEAIKIIKRVAEAIPDVHLIIVGLEDGGSCYRDIVKKWGIEGNVTFVAPTSDVGEYYKKASLHLLTSVTESFCLVIAEAKSYRIATVMYDIPFLELTEDGKGVEVVRQDDSDAAARRIVELMSDSELLRRKGEEAYSTLARFNDKEVIARWNVIFDKLDSGEQVKAGSDIHLSTIVRQVYSAWMNHCEQNVWKIEFFDNIERATGRSAKGLIDGITGRIIEPLKRIKRKFK